MKQTLTAFLIIFLCACSATRGLNWQNSGPDFAPSKNDTEVLYAAPETERAFAYNGLITSSTLKEKTFVSRAKKLAAEKGADGIVVVDKDNTLLAYTYKYLDTLTKDDEQKIRDHQAKYFFRD